MINPIESLSTPDLITELVKRHRTLLIAGVVCNEVTGPNPANFFHYFGSKAECLGILTLASDHLRSTNQLKVESSNRIFG